MRHHFHLFVLRTPFIITPSTGQIQMNTTLLDGKLGLTLKKPSYRPTGTHPFPRSVLVWRSASRSVCLLLKIFWLTDVFFDQAQIETRPLALELKFVSGTQILVIKIPYFVSQNCLDYSTVLYPTFKKTKGQFFAWFVYSENSEYKKHLCHVNDIGKQYS